MDKVVVWKKERKEDINLKGREIEKKREIEITSPGSSIGLPKGMSKVLEALPQVFWGYLL